MYRDFMGMSVRNPLKTMAVVMSEWDEKEIPKDKSILRRILINNILIWSIRVILWILGFIGVIWTTVLIGPPLDRICPSIAMWVGVVLGLGYVYLAVIVSIFEFGINTSYYRMEHKLKDKKNG